MQSLRDCFGEIIKFLTFLTNKVMIRCFFLFERVDFAALLLFLTVTLYVWKYNDNFFFNGDKYYTVCWIIISSCFKNSNFVLSQTSLRIYASLNLNVIPGFIKEVKKKINVDNLFHYNALNFFLQRNFAKRQTFVAHSVWHWRRKFRFGWMCQTLHSTRAAK